jgi:hypothetical protein
MRVHAQTASEHKGTQNRTGTHRQSPLYVSLAQRVCFVAPHDNQAVLLPEKDDEASAGMGAQNTERKEITTKKHEERTYREKPD